MIGAVGLLLFVLVERWYGDDALLPLRLFRNSVFSLVTVVGVIVGMAMFGGIAVLPQFLQIVRGASPIESGFLMLPLVAGIMTASVTSGQLTSRTGRYKVFPVVGTLLMTGALVILSFRINVDIPFWELDLYMAMFGLGLGSCMQTLVLAVQNASPARDMGVVTASSTFFRQLGGTLGTAVFFSILFSTLPDKISGRADVGRADRPGVPGRDGRSRRARQPGQRAVLRAGPGRRRGRAQRLGVPADDRRPARPPDPGRLLELDHAGVPGGGVRDRRRVRAGAVRAGAAAADDVRRAGGRDGGGGAHRRGARHRAAATAVPGTADAASGRRTGTSSAWHGNGAAQRRRHGRGHHRALGGTTRPAR